MLIEFHCKCGAQFEHFYKNSRANYVERCLCPKCGKDAPRVLSAPGSIRGGIYATTYGKEGKQ